ICVNYLQLQLDCDEDEKFREEFFNYPHYYLNVKVGMTIPKDVAILFDTTGTSPSVCVMTDDGDHYEVIEGQCSLEIIADLKSGDKIDEIVKTKKSKEVDVYLPEHLKGSKTVVKLPFLDVRADMLGEIKFEDSEIILTCA
ncbi:MAG: hypothetical protein GY816_12810, partial [Cytophagales bacterium]|nr:hypothetical protein [Cytophagales bacterium]